MNPLSTLLVVYTGAAFGLAYIAGHSVISLPLRLAWQDTKRAPWLLDLVECPACFGFWIGLASGALAVWFALAPVEFAILLPFYTSGSNYTLGRLTGLIREE